MNTLLDSQKANLPALELPGWNAAISAQKPGEENSGCSSRMSEPVLSPGYLQKRQRLSHLLDKLSIQFRHKMHYIPPRHWLRLESSYIEPKQVDDAPLDLSIKAETASSQGHEYTCGECGQTFSLHDRLAKHIASRHRNRTPDAARAYECEICRRKFARSDMLTRHARLHSGIKPYSCSACGQVFSRSDHLATHQRTHTGEKPYRCPTCPYAACRRDMITRHMRTHTRRPQPA